MYKMTKDEYQILTDAIRSTERALEDARAGKKGLGKWVSRLEERLANFKARQANAVVVDESELDRRTVKIGLR